MFPHSGKCPIWAIVFLLLVSVAGPKAQAQGYELRCQGRGGAFVIERIDANTLSLRFTASSRTAGADYGALDPGTCSWPDRAVNAAEPLLIHFTADSSQAALISQQLNDPNNYWSFFVFNTNQGYFEAKSQNAWTIAQPITADITPRPSQTTKVQATTPQRQTIGGDIVARRREPASSGSAIAKPRNEDAKFLQIFRDVKIEDITARSFTLSFTTTQPVKAEVRVWIWSSGFFGANDWMLDRDVEYAFGWSGSSVTISSPSTQSTHRIIIRLRRDMVTGERRQLYITALSPDGEHFYHQQIFTTP